MPHDVIGDIHGECDKLTALLSRMGYAESGGLWRHPSRTAVFVGDLIDRGPKQLETVDLVQRMVVAGAARCVMGNHEFNAIAWATPDPERPGHFLRDHHKPGNRKQHAAFLEAVEGTSRHPEIIAWFRTLPLWLDLGPLRIVHACWDEASMQVLRPVLGAGDTLTDAAVLRGSRPGDPVFEAIEVVLKGPEIDLPAGVEFTDQSGKLRKAVRVRWWQSDLSTYRQAAIGPAGDSEMIPDGPLPGRLRRPDTAGPPVLFGHYWFSGTPSVISSRFACLDYSVARQGPLVAYRWDGETELADDKLIWA